MLHPFIDHLYPLRGLSFCHFALFAPSLPPDYSFGLWSVWLLPLDRQFAVFTKQLEQSLCLDLNFHLNPIRISKGKYFQLWGF